MIESGFPGLSLGFWTGLWAPAGTPAAIVDTLNASANRVMASPEMRAAMAAARRRAEHRHAEGLRRFHRRRSAEVAAKIVEASGVQIN